MRILLLNANRSGVGTYHRALWFGRSLAAGGHTVTLMTVSNTNRFMGEVRVDDSGMTIIECPNWLDELLPWHASGPLDILRRIWEILTHRYDVVYAFEYQPNVSIPVFATRLIKRFTLISDWCDWHAGGSYHFGGRKWAHAIDRVFEEFIRHRADHLTVINQVLRDRALSIGIPAGRITVVSEGVDPEYIRPMGRVEARARLGLPPEAVILGTIRDSESGLAVLLEAVRQVAREVPTIRLLFIGAAPSGMDTLASRHAVLDRVIAPGRVSDDDLPYYLAAADILALPLADTLVNRGRWPHKLGDLLAAERPVIVSAGGEFPIMLGARACAQVVPFSGEAYADAVLELLRSPGEAAELARRGRRLIVDELNWTTIGSQLRKLVERVAGAPPIRASPERSR
jgi:glycosyltransferase involved in cell wall biosynthesis